MEGNGEYQGRLPFDSAVMSGAKLDVIYYLLRHYLDAIKNHKNVSVIPQPLHSTVKITGDSGVQDFSENYVPPNKEAKAAHTFLAPNTSRI
jgi:hypothetical protein